MNIFLRAFQNLKSILPGRKSEISHSEMDGQKDSLPLQSKSHEEPGKAEKSEFSSEQTPDGNFSPVIIIGEDADTEDTARISTGPEEDVLWQMEWQPALPEPPAKNSNWDVTWEPIKPPKFAAEETPVSESPVEDDFNRNELSVDEAHFSEVIHGAEPSGEISEEYCTISDWIVYPDHLPDAEPERDYREEVLDFENSLEHFMLEDSTTGDMDADWRNENITEWLINESDAMTGLKDSEEDFPDESFPENKGFFFYEGPWFQDEIQRFVSFAFDQQCVPMDLLQELQEQIGISDHRFILLVSEFLEENGVPVSDEETGEIRLQIFRSYEQYEIDPECCEEESEQLVELLTEELFQNNEVEWIHQEKVRPEKGTMSTEVGKAREFLLQIHRELTGIPGLPNLIVQYMERQYQEYLQVAADPDRTFRNVPEPLKTLFSKKLFRHAIRLLKDDQLTWEEFLAQVVYSIDIASVILKELPDLMELPEAMVFRPVQILEQLEGYRNRIVESCVSSVIHMVLKKRLSQQYSDLADDIQEGMTAMCVAARKFDLKSNVQIMAYTSFWVMQYLQRSLKRSSMIYIPDIHWEQLFTFVKSCGREFFWENVRTAELPEELGIFQALAEESSHISETDWNLLEEVAWSWHLVYEDQNLEMLETGELHRLVRNALEKIPSRHRNILMSRYGFRNTVEKTLEEMAGELKLTRQRIQQLVRRGLQLWETELKKDRSFSDFMPWMQMEEERENPMETESPTDTECETENEDL